VFFREEELELLKKKLEREKEEEKEKELEFEEFFKEDFEKFEERYKTVISTLRSFLANAPLSISSDDIYHIIIVTILVLERACLFYASSSRPPYTKALDMACSRYTTSDTHNALMVQFPSCRTYSISKISDFILNYSI